ncbi:MAG: lipase [Hyphomonadaceae bacterium BRH_c29]|nr:MAG: lipase [Hyphomonadaceae bacterium BRH_c29]
MPSKNQHDTFDPHLAGLLPALERSVPVRMTIDRLGYFRKLSTISRHDVIGGAPVLCVDHEIPAHDGRQIAVSIISRSDHQRPGPGIYFMHGGGMVMGNRFAGAHPLVGWAIEHDAVCVTVEYRLAPEFPAPIPSEDSYCGLRWMAANAEDLKFDPARLVVFGGSGGGGLAAAVTLMARDRNGPRLSGQLLQCPMLDDRNQTFSSQQYDGVGVWDRTSNATAWRALLGGRCGGEEVGPYEAPARARDLSGLPPTYIDVGGAEVFRDEALAYAAGILASGGVCELHVWGGAFHGFYDIAPQTNLARHCIATRDAWLRRLLAAQAAPDVVGSFEQVSLAEK